MNGAGFRTSPRDVISPANVAVCSKCVDSLLQFCNGGRGGRVCIEAVKVCEAEGLEGGMMMRDQIEV